MSLQTLNQVFEETRRLSIAGSNLACGDFRLKKLIDPLQKSADKAPVFGTVASAIDRLVSGSEKESAQSLLDLSSLVLAILYTQGQTSVQGTLTPIESTELPQQTTQLSSRILKPLLHALTSKGSGRLEVIREGYDQGAFDDLRLVNPAISALDDSYAEIADLVADKILPKYGKAILPEIRRNIDMKGRAGNLRRLRILYQLDPASARPIVLEAFENGSKEMKIAALGCLGDFKEDLPHLLEQATSKNKEVRRAAIGRLGKFSDDDSAQVLTKALRGKDLELAVVAISENNNRDLWENVMQETQAQVSDLLSTRDKSHLGKMLERTYTLLSCYFGRNDEESVAQLASIYDQRARLEQLKSASSVGGRDVLSKVCHAILLSGDKTQMQRLIDDRNDLRDECFKASFASAILLLSPKKVYENYAEFFVQQAKKTASRRLTQNREMLKLLTNEPENTLQWYDDHGLHDSRMLSVFKTGVKNKKRDPRWLDAAIEMQDVNFALQFGNSKDKKLKEFLTSRFQKTINSKSVDGEILRILEAMIEFRYPEATGHLIDVLNRQSKSKSRYYYYSYWLTALISKLPKSSAKEIEKALPNFPERMVDELLPHLQTLKAKAK